MCRPALAAAMPATIGRFAAANQAIARGLSSAPWSADLIQAHHSVASVTTAAASTTASGTLHGRTVAALIRRATDSPSTIRTNSWKRSARWEGLSREPPAGREHPQRADRVGGQGGRPDGVSLRAAQASEDSHSAPPEPKQTR